MNPTHGEAETQHIPPLSKGRLGGDVLINK